MTVYIADHCNWNMSYPSTNAVSHVFGYKTLILLASVESLRNVWRSSVIEFLSVDSAVKWVPGGDNLVKGVQCYELFGGIALKNHAFSFLDKATASEKVIVSSDFKLITSVFEKSLSFRALSSVLPSEERKWKTQYESEQRKMRLHELLETVKVTQELLLNILGIDA